MKHLITAVWFLVVSSASAQLPASFAPTPDAIAALASDAEVTVTSTRDQLYTFRPVAGTPTRGLILYPGGFVDVRAYAPLARAIAAEGYVVALVRMPLDIAFLGYQRALFAQFINRDIRTWAVGGHSLGGVAACTYAKEYRRFTAGVLLLASYPSSSDNLRFSRLPVSSVYGTLDGLTDATDIDRSRRLLPADTTFVPIEGGNHTQFGAYTDGVSIPFLQPGDLPATITPANQQQQIVDAAIALLERL
jgi:dienelactone hydrolase